MKYLLTMMIAMEAVACVRAPVYVPDHTAEHEDNLLKAQDHATLWQERESRVKDYYMELK